MQGEVPVAQVVRREGGKTKHPPTYPTTWEADKVLGKVRWTRWLAEKGEETKHPPTHPPGSPRKCRARCRWSRW